MRGSGGVVCGSKMETQFPSAHSAQFSSSNNNRSNENSSRDDYGEDDDGVYF